MFPGFIATYRPSYEVGIFSMRSVPVTTVEYPYSIFTHRRERLEEANEAMLIINLCKYRSVSVWRRQAQEEANLELWSRRHCGCGCVWFEWETDARQRL